MRVTADHCGFYPRKSQLPRMKALGMILSCGGTTINRSAPGCRFTVRTMPTVLLPSRALSKQA